jgi:hypothetical protein
VTDVNHNHEPWVKDLEVKHTGGDTLQDMPSHESITETKIVGPAKLKVKAHSNAGRFSSNNFFSVFSVYRK